jgi:hypothetical protein
MLGEKAHYMPDRLGEKYGKALNGGSTAFIKSQTPRPGAMSDALNLKSAEQQPALGTIKWDPDLGALCASRVSQTNDVHSVQSIWPECLPHVTLCFERYEFQAKHFGISWPSPIEMVVRSLAQGPSFTELWGKAWKDSRFNMLLNFESIAPDDIHARVIQMESYDKVFSPFFLPFWEEDCDDWKYMFGGKPEHVDENMLERITMKCAAYASKYVPDSFKENPLHIYRPTASNGFDGVDTTVQEWELEYDDPVMDYDSPYMIAKRSIARKRPTEVRDIGILTPGSIRSHRRFMSVLQLIASKLPNCPHGKSQDYVKSLVRKIGSGTDYFFMRDYTKSGMTVPHEVIEAVMSGIFQDDDELRNLSVNFYKKGVVLIEENGQTSFRHPDTGVPLGLWVEGYTILQYAIHDIIMQELGPGMGRIMHSATNDDMVVGFSNLETRESYMALDVSWNSGIGMAVKFAKSGSSDHSFMYCEEYWRESKLLSKTSLFVLGILGAKYAVNIVHAKELCHSILLCSPHVEEVHKTALSEVQARWGWEFSEQEHGWPFLFGGWLPQIINGVDHSIEWFDGDFIAGAAYWSSRIRNYKRTKLDDLPHLTIGRKLEIQLLREPEKPTLWADLIPYLGDKKTLKAHFGRLPPKALEKRWNLLLKARAERFESYITGQQSMPVVREKWYARHPNSVILKWMPGVVTSSSTEMIKNPRIGLRETGGQGMLFHMRCLGYISCRLSRDFLQLTMTEQKFLSRGWTKELQYETLPLPIDGCGEEIIGTFYSDLEGFYSRTGLSVVSVLGNPPVHCTRFWSDVPMIPLSDVFRLLYNFRMYGMIWHSDFAKAHVARVLGKAFNIPHEPWGMLCVDEVTADEQEFLDVLRNSAPDLLSKEEVDSVIKTMAGRIVPAFTKSSADEPHDSLFGSYYGTAPTGNSEAANEEPEADSWQLPDDGYDIWESLGA